MATVEANQRLTGLVRMRPHILVFNQHHTHGACLWNHAITYPSKTDQEGIHNYVTCPSGTSPKLCNAETILGHNASGWTANASSLLYSVKYYKFVRSIMLKNIYNYAFFKNSLI